MAVELGNVKPTLARTRAKRLANIITFAFIERAMIKRIVKNKFTVTAERKIFSTENLLINRALICAHPIKKIALIANKKE